MLDLAFSLDMFGATEDRTLTGVMSQLTCKWAN